MNESTAAILKHIADKLDVPVAQLWSGIVAYAPFWFYKYIAMVGACFLVCAVLVALSFKLYDKEATYSDANMPSILAGIFAVVLFAATAIVGAANLGYALAAKNAPEAWASIYIMQTIERR